MVGACRENVSLLPHLFNSLSIIPCATDFVAHGCCLRGQGTGLNGVTGRMASQSADKTAKRVRIRSAFVVCASALALVACATSGPKVTVVKKPKSKEYFSERDYGVKASPRVVNVAMASMPGAKVTRMPRGGGREQVGKPYKVKGKWYYPKEDPNYRVAGTASWYGDAFHGRLTANGEVYDMNHLSAAHPTMPLPSYARVTNKKNGNSVIVRVNDRGPYAHGRVIDLSKRAAQLLDYTSTGTAQVVVEYVGRAPVDGADDEYLLASFRPGGSSNPGEVSPGVMVAMAGAQPDSTLALAGSEPTAPTAIAPALPSDPFEPMAASTMPQPTAVPLPTVRPRACVDFTVCDLEGTDVLLSGYADANKSGSSAAAFRSLGLDAAPDSGWKESVQERILVGVFDRKSFKGMETKLSELASVSTEVDGDGAISVYVVPRKGGAIDKVLQSLWRHGFVDAFVVR